MKKNKLSYILIVLLVCSCVLNLYLLKPNKNKNTIEKGTYVNNMRNGQRYMLSVFEDNSIILYDPFNTVEFEGELKYLEDEDCYQIITEKQIYQVELFEEKLLLPIIKDSVIIPKVFEKIDSATVTFSQN